MLAIIVHRSHITNVIIETCNEREGADENMEYCVNFGLKNPLKDIEYIDEEYDYYVTDGRKTSEISEVKSEDQADHGKLLLVKVMTDHENLLLFISISFEGRLSDNSFTLCRIVYVL